MRVITALLLTAFVITGCAQVTGSKTSFNESYIEKVQKTIKDPVKLPEKKVEEVVKVIQEEKKKAVEMVKKKQSVYEEEKKSLLVRLIKNPPTPIKTPEKILRVLILPYVDENKVLHTQHFSFIKVDDGSWILGDYLLKEGKMIDRNLTPLEVEKNGG